MAFIQIANATMDYKYDLNFTGTVGTWTSYRNHSFGGAAAGTDNENTLVTAAIIPSTAAAGTTSGVGLVQIEVVMDVTVTGELQFRWAQNSSDPGNITCRAGSYLEWIKIA